MFKNLHKYKCHTNSLLQSDFQILFHLRKFIRKLISLFNSIRDIDYV